MFLLHFKQVGGRERKRPQAGIILLNSPITAENIFHFCCEILNGKRQYHRRCWRRYFGQSYWSLLMCPEGKGRRSQPGGRARTRAHTRGQSMDTNRVYVHIHITSTQAPTVLMTHIHILPSHTLRTYMCLPEIYTSSQHFTGTPSAQPHGREALCVSFCLIPSTWVILRPP